MDILKVMIAAFSATNVMTTFSYLLSVRYKRLFKEPVLLNYVFDRFANTESKWKGFLGWLVHYLIGLVFVIVYASIWDHTPIEFGWVSGIVFGVISGFIGILGWHLLFKIPAQTPNVKLKEYYVQLFFAHIIFAGTVVAAFLMYHFDPISRI